MTEPERWNGAECAAYLGITEATWLTRNRRQHPPGSFVAPVETAPRFRWDAAAVRALPAGGRLRARRSDATSAPPAGELRRLYQDEGYVLEQLAEHYGVPVSRAYQWLRTAGIQRRNQGDSPRRVRRPVEPRPAPEPRTYAAEHRTGVAVDPDQVARLRHLYVVEGLTQREVAARLGTTRHQVRQRMIDAGIPMHPVGYRRKS